SRTTVTGACKPVTLSEPSSWGREALAAQTNQPKAANATSSTPRMIALKIRTVLERCVLGGDRVTVAMEAVDVPEEYRSHSQNRNRWRVQSQPSRLRNSVMCATWCGPCQAYKA